MRLSRAQGLDGVGEAFDGFGEALLQEPRAFSGDPSEVRRHWRRGQHENEGNDREQHSCDCGRDEHVIGIGKIKTKNIKRDMLEWLDVAQGCKSEEGEKD